MNPRELQIQFERLLQSLYPDFDYVTKNQLNSDTIFYFINEAAEDFVKSRVNGTNIYREGAEQTQAMIDDLRTLIKSANIVSPELAAISTKPNAFGATLPSDYYYALDEEVDIKVGSSASVRKGIKEVTSDTYRSNLDDVYSEHNLQYGDAKPLRLFENDKVLLITDGNYTIEAYYLRYYKLPNEVDLDAYLADNTTGLLDLPEQTHSEIIRMAVELAIKSIPVEDKPVQ